MDFKFDVVIFGATGWIGKCVVLEAVNVLEGLTWAIAGYSRGKLENILAQTSHRTKTDLRSVSILIADANDPMSIECLAKKCKVLLNCCGPYQLWAELIIDSCIKSGTHYVDMCNDPYFNELMELRYHQMAVEKNVYVISSCGFYSFPIEMGLNYIKQHFIGTVNHVDAYVRYNFARGSCFPTCPLFSHSVWLNMVWLCALYGELPWLRQELREIPLPMLTPRQPRKELFHKSTNFGDAVFLRFPFVDQQIVERSQYRFYLHEKVRPMQFYQYLEFPSFFWALVFLVWFLVISILAQYFVTRNFIVSHPKLFSMGVCSSSSHGNCANQICTYSIILNAEGWPTNVENTVVGPCSMGRSGAVDQRMTLEISGNNPIYGCGCLCLLLGARCLLDERDKLPGSGGVYSPGYAFHKTKILDKLSLFPNYISFRLL